MTPARPQIDPLRAFKTFAASPRAGLAAALVALVCALAGVFTMPVLDRDEARFAQATAQMLETGDYVRINFQDEPRHKKPAGIYWLQAISVAAVSDVERREIWAWRLPSVLAAVIAALTALQMGRLLAGPGPGFAAALLLAPGFLLASEGGIAKTDAALCAAAGLAVYCLIRLRQSAGAPGTGARVFAAAAWAAVAAGVLIKGPVAPAAAGLGVLALVVWERRIDWVRPLFFWAGPAIAAAILLPWIIAVEAATGGAFLREAILGDFAPKVASGHEGHGAPPGAHLLFSPATLFPMIVFLPAGFALIWRHRKTAGPAGLAARALIAFTVPFWLLFEIAPTKLIHYTLPVHVPLAVIAGMGMTGLGSAPRWTRWLGGVLGLTGAVAAAVAAGWMHEAFSPGGLAEAVTVRIALSLVIVLALATALAAGAGRALAALVLVCASAALWHAGARGVAAPGAESLFPARMLAAELETRGWRDDAPAIFSSFTEPSLVFLLDGAPRLLRGDEIPAALEAETGPAIVIVDEARDGPASSEAALAGRPVCDRFTVDGFNYSRGEPTYLVVARVDPACAPPGPSQEETP